MGQLLSFVAPFLSPFVSFFLKKKRAVIECATAASIAVPTQFNEMLRTPLPLIDKLIISPDTVV